MIKSVTCSYCGLPFKTSTGGDAAEEKRYYCCTGCAMLARVPLDEKGQFPVNTQLVSMLTTGFLYFNQLLFWLLAVLLAMQGKAELSGRFYWISAAVAAGVWAAVAFLQWRERAAKAADVVALFVTFGVHAWMIAVAAPLPRVWPMAVANAALIAWSVRGLLRGRKK